jgi:hypothetical protein
MMENDADRLETIKALGGQRVFPDTGECWAIFDDAGSQISLGDYHINSTSPQLTLRKSDAAQHALESRGTAVLINDKRYTVRETLQGQPPGWTAILLDTD